MSLCEPCLKTLPLPFCAGDVTLGIVADSNTDYIAVIKNTATGRIVVEEVTSNGSGVIVLEWPDRLPDTTYEVQLWDGTEFDILDGADPVTCVSVRFERMEGFDPANVTVTAA